jgi:hypothetical protein
MHRGLTNEALLTEPRRFKSDGKATPFPSSRNAVHEGLTI